MAALKFEHKTGSFQATLGAVLAEGGMGFVQEARREGIGTRIVVKRAKKGGEALLEYERHTCEQVGHPALVRYLGSCTTPDMGPLLAFEQLAGNPLLVMNGEQQRPKWRDPGTFYYPLPPNRALELCFDLLLALEHLHEKGFIHADVKLANLLARVPGGTDAPNLLKGVAEGNFNGVLIDLGSVRSVGVLKAISSGQADPTLIPSVTPLYAPPEALMERSETGGRKLFTPVMDIYAFGLVFYVLLTGRLPYEGHAGELALRDNDLVLDLKNREARGELSPIDARALARIPLHDVGFEGVALAVWPYFHAAAKELLLRCLEPDPEKRIDASAARAFFQESFKMKLQHAQAPRAWTQGMFQMRPRSNRLLGDLPAGTIKIREEKDEFICEEVAPAVQPAVGRETVSVEDGSTLSYVRTAARKPPDSRRVSKAPPAPKGMIYLADVLREFKARRPLPVTPPVIVTRTGLSPPELVQCTIFSLGQGRQHVTLNDDVDEVKQKKQVSVGRGEDNDIVIPDSSVSKKHLFFEQEEDGGWWIVDNGSSNGTFVEDSELQRNGRMRLTRSLVTIGVGLSSKITFMQEGDLEAYLARALDVWSQAFASKARPATGRVKAGGTVVQREEPTPSSTEIVQPGFVSSVQKVNPTAPTTRQRRPSSDELLALPPAVDVTPRSGGTSQFVNATPGGRPRQSVREEIGKKLAELDGKASFAIHFADARVEDCDTVAEVLELLAAEGEAVEGVDALMKLSSEKVVLYRRQTA